MSQLKNSKSAIDAAGKFMSLNGKSDPEYKIHEEIFDSYRTAHLEPITRLTLMLQQWLTAYKGKYYIAQRLKRKPQIIRKLKRFKSRLTQLQDIGGCRIIVEDNAAVDELHSYLLVLINNEKSLISLSGEKDYREEGREESGYRALHLIFKSDQVKLELQIRSEIQHYWAESIERTSVIYGHHLKEQEGDLRVINYFKELSDLLHEIELGRQISPQQKIDIDRHREAAEDIIKASDKHKVLNSTVAYDVINTFIQMEKGRLSFHNFIMVFNWTTGSFETWVKVDKNIEDVNDIVSAYISYEEQFTTEDGYEVVLIGSSDPSTIQKTHSHYFGVAGYDDILDSFGSAASLEKREKMELGAREVLLALKNKKSWNRNTSIGYSTIKNHICKNVKDIDIYLEKLKSMELIIYHGNGGPISLNVKKSAEIDSYL